jgi:hypothetical protein
MSILKRREIPIAICIITTVFLLFSYYTGIAAPFATDMRGWMIQISTFAMFLGVFMLFRRHTQILLRKAEGWPYSAIIFGFFLFYLVVQYSSKELYNYVLMNVYTPMAYASASAVVPITIYWRGTKVRSIFSGLLVLTLLITNFSSAAIGTTIFGPGITVLGAWIKNVINTGVMRAITIGMGLGLLTVILRIFLGMETSYLGEIS